MKKLNEVLRRKSFETAWRQVDDPVCDGVWRAVGSATVDAVWRAVGNEVLVEMKETVKEIR